MNAAHFSGLARAELRESLLSIVKSNTLIVSFYQTECAGVRARTERFMNDRVTDDRMDAMISICMYFSNHDKLSLLEIQKEIVVSSDIVLLLLFSQIMVVTYLRKMYTKFE